VGNALIALYRLGDATAIGSLYDLISHPEPAFRATGVWAMGETGDTRFLPVLGRILTDPNETIKAATFRAIRKLRGNDHANGIPLAVRVLSEPKVNQNCITVIFGIADGSRPLAGIAATQIRIVANGEHVFRYSVQEQESAKRISAGFLLCGGVTCRGGQAQSQRESIERCFEQRRGAEPWLVAQYNGSATNHSRPEVLFGVRLDATDSAHVRRISSLTDLRNAVEVKENIRRMDFPTAFLALCQELRPSRLSAHMFQLFPEIAEVPDVANLIRAAQEARVSVHAISETSDRQIREMCVATGGFHVTGSDAPGGLCAIYRGLSHRYQASINVEEEVKTVQVVVRSADWSGESPILELENSNFS
jgi:hypothetical protein